MYDIFPSGREVFAAVLFLIVLGVLLGLGLSWLIQHIDVDVSAVWVG